MNVPDVIRTLTIAGCIHHGKTTFLQMLVDQTHENITDYYKNVFIQLQKIIS